MNYSINLLTLNQQYHLKEMNKYVKPPLMKEYYEHHKNIYEDLDKAINKLSANE